MSRNIITGIDIGTHQIKVLIIERAQLNNSFIPKILGAGTAESKGLRHGYIVNKDDAKKNIQEAISMAERLAGVSVKNAFVSVGGVGLSSTNSKGKVSVTRADMEVTETDIKNVSDVAEIDIPTSITLNRKIIHSVPVEYKLDGQVVLGNPVGLKGASLEVKMLFITSLEHHLTDLMDVIESLNIQIEDVIASPIASSFVSLSKTQKIAGCVLVNIGSETVSAVVFENNLPISLEIFPVGGSDITNDIALGFKLTLEEAEQVKLGGITPNDLSSKKLDEVINYRLSEIFKLINNHLKKINRQELLPAGVVITGGGSASKNILDLAKKNTNLPSSIAQLNRSSKSHHLKDSSWSVAYGLCIIGMTEGGNKKNKTSEIFRRNWKPVSIWIKQFLP